MERQEREPLEDAFRQKWTTDVGDVYSSAVTSPAVAATAPAFRPYVPPEVSLRKFLLHQITDEAGSASLLLVDNGFSWMTHLAPRSDGAWWATSWRMSESQLTDADDATLLLTLHVLYASGSEPDCTWRVDSSNPYEHEYSYGYATVWMSEERFRHVQYWSDADATLIRLLAMSRIASWRYADEEKNRHEEFMQKPLSLA